MKQIELEWRKRSRTAETASFRLDGQDYKAQVYWHKETARWNILWYPERNIAAECAKGNANSLRAAKEEVRQKIMQKIIWDQAALTG